MTMPEENADLVAAVDHGGVLQLTGDGEGEIVPHDDEIGDIQRAGQDHDPEVPGQVERFVEHILRDEAAGKEQVEDHKRVDELHAADVDLADGVAMADVTSTESAVARTVLTAETSRLFV